MSIVLTGMRGAGKSSLGVALADRLGRGFVDVDQHLEKKWGCKVIEVCVGAVSACGCSPGVYPSLLQYHLIHCHKPTSCGNLCEKSLNCAKNRFNRLVSSPPPFLFACTRFGHDCIMLTLPCAFLCIQYVEQHGWEAFRAEEGAALRALLKDDAYARDHVIACGGGVIGQV